MLSFIGTFVVLVSIFGATFVYSYFNSVPVRHLPQDLPSYDALWGKYAPRSAIQVGFLNYTALRHANSSLPFHATILHLSNPALVINSSDAVYFETMVFETPNSTLDFAFLNAQKFSDVVDLFAPLGAFEVKFGNDSLYAVQDVATGKSVLGWLGIVPGERAVAFVAGQNEAKQLLLSVLDVPNHASSSMIDVLAIRQMLWTVGGAQHLSLGIQNFTGEIKGAQRVLTTVDASRGRVNLTRVVQFENFTTARDQYSEVRLGFKSATNFVVYDALVRVSQLDRFADLGGDYRLVL